MRMHLRGGRGAASAASLAALLALGIAGCTAPGAPARTAAVPHRSYPIATPGPNVTKPLVVAAGGYGLVAAGSPVRVLSGGTEALVTASGPDVDEPVPKPGQPQTAVRAHGVLTVTVAVSRGIERVVPGAFLGLDERAHPIVLHPDRGAQTARPGRPVTLHLAATFATGHTTLTWQPRGTPLVTWDCTIEID